MNNVKKDTREGRKFRDNGWIMNKKKRPEKFPTEQGMKSCWRCHDKYARYNEYVVIWDEFHYFFYATHMSCCNTPCECEHI